MKQVILGTDWWTDCDDAVAIRLLANLHKAKQVELLGVAVSGCMEHTLTSLDAFLQHDGLTVPIGIDREATDFGGKPPYQRRLAELPSRFKDNTPAEDPVKLYRRLLAGAKDKIELIEIGYPQILAALLASSGDEFSPLTGLDLVKQKVGHLWIMAGKWDEPNGGRENNFARNRRASEAAGILCDKWPTDITFLGWEVGSTVISGSKLPASDILKQALVDHGSADGRSSWDPMLILLAVTGDLAKAGYDGVRGTVTVDAATGCNYFKPSADGRHCYVVKLWSDSAYADAIDQRINHQE